MGVRSDRSHNTRGDNRPTAKPGLANGSVPGCHPNHADGVNERLRMAICDRWERGRSFYCYRISVPYLFPGML